MVAGDGQRWPGDRQKSGALLVDTLFDLALTQQMLDARARRSPPQRRSTHAGQRTRERRSLLRLNQLVTGAQIIASAASAAEMESLRHRGLMRSPSSISDPKRPSICASRSVAFRFDNIDLAAPDPLHSASH
ncbi:MAG: hypothetical protein R2706_08825 [Acidimicrobiales bacterium]